MSETPFDKNGTCASRTPLFLFRMSGGISDRSKDAYDSPASSTSTDTLGFSVKRLATTLPAVPPEIGSILRTNVKLHRHTSNDNEIIVQTGKVSDILVHLTKADTAEER